MTLIGTKMVSDGGVSSLGYICCAHTYSRHIYYISVLQSDCSAGSCSIEKIPTPVIVCINLLDPLREGTNSADMISHLIKFRSVRDTGPL